MIEIGARDWVFITASCAALLSLIGAALIYKKPNTTKAALWGLRIAALALLLSATGEIRWRGFSKGTPGILQVAVDTSKSMEDDKAALQKTLESLESWAKANRIELQYHRFDSKTSPLKIPLFLKALSKRKKPRLAPLCASLNPISAKAQPS